MIRRCKEQDLEAVYAVINDAAQAYRGVIPEDRWHEPYMSSEELRHEITHGVVFWGYEEAGNLIGVMGIQHVQDVTLIRHAYVRTDHQRQGVGRQLLRYLMEQTTRPTLVGTWADAVWAIRFYEKHGFRLLSGEEKDQLLRKYWSIPERQVETSVVLADRRWFAMRQGQAEGTQAHATRPKHPNSIIHRTGGTN
jgi:N-acetylglutamate synthase-like GNAT family acetyltransferase